MFGMSMRRLLLVGGAMSAAMLGQEAVAQDADAGGTLEEIVVTARRREENLQATPVAITAVTSETLERRNVVTLEQVARLAPNFNIYPTAGGIGSGGNYIRGIGYADPLPGQDNSIGIYVDGVIYGRNTISMMSLIEPDRVEVLRGPQGTLFGRNTTGGAVLISSHTPSDEFNGMAKASYGSYSAASFQARIDSGLLGDSGIKLSAAFQHRQRDGTFNATTRPRDKDPGAERNDAYWFKAVGSWDKFTATLAADYNDVRGYPAPLQVVAGTAAVQNLFALSPTLGGRNYPITNNPLYTLADGTSGEQRVWAQGVSLTLNYELNEHLSLKSISAVRAYRAHTPSAYGPTDFRANLGTAAAPRILSFEGLFSFPLRDQGQRQKSQELQLLGSAGDFEYVAGVYYYKETAWDASVQRLLNPTPLLEIVGPRLYRVGSKSIAGFAQVDYRPSFLDKKLELTGGVRWTKDNRDFAQTIPVVRSPSLETKNTSFLVSANYQWTPGLMTFVRYSTAYRAGGFNARAGATVDPIFRPEKLKSLEGGFKLDAFDQRVRLNGAAFYNKYHDLQTGFFVPPGVNNPAGNIAINADAEYNGFELELTAVPTRGLTLSASVGYVDREYTSFPKTLLAGGALNAGCMAVLGPTGGAVAQNCAKIAHFLNTPNKSADVSVTYALPASYGEWSFFASYSYKGKVYSATYNTPTDSPFFSVVNPKGYGLLSARVALSDIPLSGNVKGQIAVFGDNLTDKEYNNAGVDFVSYATKVFGTRRTFGVEAKVEF
jgi:iron complex outermembrane receptor protein